MTDNTENLILEHLKAFRSELRDLKSTMQEEFKELKTRVSSLESGQAMMIQHVGHLSSLIAQQQVGVDRLGGRIERIEKRLELV